MPTAPSPPAVPIEAHGVIGDLETVALVGMDGAIDFMCAPHFDSPSVFASLLDPARGGRFQIAPLLPAHRPVQIYLPDSAVLLTRFLSAEGMCEVSDFMPIDEDGRHVVVRRAKCIRGHVPFRVVCAPRFDYARAGHRVRQTPGEVLFVPDGGGQAALRLRTRAPVRCQDGDAVGEFTLAPGQSVAFVLEQLRDGEASPTESPDYVPASFKRTVNFWRRWVARSTYQGRWRETVNRSAMTLKLLTSARRGSIVAAPTFGLPEHIGGRRNWDYRYVWIRDASFTLYALMRLGYTEEAARFMRWLEARCAELEPDGSLRIMYGLDGRHHLPEVELPHLAGYRGSRPVRVGNDAHDQLQLDIYGELMDAVYLYDKYGEAISLDLWANLVRLVDWVTAHWREPDEGIWEVRGGRREFLYSRLMCWVALDRALRLADRRSLPAPVERWRAVRDAIHHDLLAHFWDDELGCFVQHRGARWVDAATLLMPLVRFVGPSDPRWLSTLRAIERELLDDSLVFRYRPDLAAPDGLEGVEGTFSMCSFWYVECLARAGDVQKARYFFEKMLGYANHLGLYGEELGPSGEHLGNFPQAFTHVALISAAYDLNRRLSAAGWGA